MYKNKTIAAYLKMSKYLAQKQSVIVVFVCHRHKTPSRWYCQQLKINYLEYDPLSSVTCQG